MAKSPIRLPSRAVHRFSGSSKLRACSQLLSSSLLSVNRSQGHQPLFQFLSEFPFCRGRPGSVGGLLSLGCQLVILQPQLIPNAGGHPGASSVFIGVDPFQHTHSSPYKTCHPLPQPHPGSISRQRSSFSICQNWDLP